MNVTHLAPQGHTNATPEGINRDLFDDALKAYIKEHGLSCVTIEDKVELLGLKHVNDFHRLRAGILPRLHKALEITGMLGLDPLALWPKPAPRQRRADRVAA